ncbi:MAG: DUF1588 domain-containing protein, partial [Deltaproteobacteria bacterium]|nr:DUF1588 domain-containing protein [Deltaproteobacteria bacterium]
TAQIGGLMRKETEHFIDDVTWNAPGDFQTLLTTPTTWVNGPLATFYGIAGIGGEAFQKVKLDATRHAGLLTQPTFLAGRSHSSSTSPVHRGLWVFQRLLCGRMEPPPLNVVVPLPPVLPATATTRQRYEQHLSDPSCVTCHRDIDPIGFAFEHYDTTGAWRDTENGQKIDATGEIFKTDAKGKFDGAIELAARLAGSQDAKNCFVGNWATFAYGRSETPDDACTHRSLQDAFARAKGNVPELLIALTQTDAFLYRPIVEVQP